MAATVKDDVKSKRPFAVREHLKNPMVAIPYRRRFGGIDSDADF